MRPLLNFLAKIWNSYSLKYQFYDRNFTLINFLTLTVVDSILPTVFTAEVKQLFTYGNAC